MTRSWPDPPRNADGLVDFRQPIPYGGDLQIKPRPVYRFGQPVNRASVDGGPSDFADGELVALLGTTDYLDWYAHVVMRLDGATVRIGAGILGLYAEQVCSCGMPAIDATTDAPQHCGDCGHPYVNLDPTATSKEQ